MAAYIGVQDGEGSMMLVIRIIALVELIYVGVILISKTLEEKKEKKEKEEKEPDNVGVGTIKTGTIQTGTIGTAYPSTIEVSHVKVPDIVRCKDCKYYYDRPNIGSYCALYNLRKNGGDWYCASAEKKERAKRMIDADELVANGLIDVNELMEFLRRN